MPKSIHPTRPLTAGFGLRVVSTLSDSTTYFVSLDLAVKALANDVDTILFYRGARGCVRGPTPELEYSQSGTCLTKTVKTIRGVHVQSPAWPDRFDDEMKTGTQSSYEVADPFGKLLCLKPLLALGLRLQDERGTYRACRPGFVQIYCGYGPVPGIRKYRNGYRFMRRMSTKAERRMNALVLTEDGEVAARTVRTGYNLPSSWDDLQREIQRCWKSQHHGSKSWNRPRTLSKTEKLYLD